MAPTSLRSAGFGTASLLFGLWTGLARLGLNLPGGAPAHSEFHSPLMISGFLGTVICLERAVALGRWWAYAAPALSAIGAFFLLVAPAPFAAGTFLLASFALTINSAVVVARQPALFTVTLAAAAVCWGVGTITWIVGHSVAEVAGWWLGFLVLTIAAERLELSRLLSPPRLSQVTFTLAASFIIIGAARGAFTGTGASLSGAGLFIATLWLVKHDVALRTVRQSGQTRFSATCMLASYFWLGIAGLILLLVPPGTITFSYDATVHAITIGFILSMIFGHAPIILPAVTGLRVKYSALAYAPLAVLHVSVLVRVAADLFEWINARAISGPLTILALAGYAGTLIIASRQK